MKSAPAMTAAQAAAKTNAQLEMIYRVCRNKAALGVGHPIAALPANIRHALVAEQVLIVLATGDPVSNYTTARLMHELYNRLSADESLR